MRDDSVVLSTSPDELHIGDVCLLCVVWFVWEKHGAQDSCTIRNDETDAQMLLLKSQLDSDYLYNGHLSSKSISIID